MRDDFFGVDVHNGKEAKKVTSEFNPFLRLDLITQR